MNRARKFEELIGGRWTGVTFHETMPENFRPAKKPMHLCEAVKESGTGPITLTRDSLNCPGGRRSMGWLPDSELIPRLAAEAGFSEEAAGALVDKVPRLDGEVAAVTVGTYDSPDILLSYLQPEAAMRFLKRWQAVNKDNLSVEISAILAVCGAVAAAAHAGARVCCSFGCAHSRKKGGIGKDRMVLGLPAGLAEELL